MHLKSCARVRASKMIMPGELCGLGHRVSQRLVELVEEEGDKDANGDAGVACMLEFLMYVRVYHSEKRTVMSFSVSSSRYQASNFPVNLVHNSALARLLVEDGI